MSEEAGKPKVLVRHQDVSYVHKVPPSRADMDRRRKEQQATEAEQRKGKSAEKC